MSAKGVLEPWRVSKWCWCRLGTEAPVQAATGGLGESLQCGVRKSWGRSTRGNPNDNLHPVEVSQNLEVDVSRFAPLDYVNRIDKYLFRVATLAGTVSVML